MEDEHKKRHSHVLVWVALCEERTRVGRQEMGRNEHRKGTPLIAGTMSSVITEGERERGIDRRACLCLQSHKIMHIAQAPQKSPHKSTRAEKMTHFCSMFCKQNRVCKLTLRKGTSRQEASEAALLEQEYGPQVSQLQETSVPPIASSWETVKRKFHVFMC